MTQHQHSSQFKLILQRRFGPLFWTQFFGAGNDNLFKFAFTVLVTYQLQLEWLPTEQAGLVIGALFVLPFLLFSATAGQLADKLEKKRIILFVKNLEIGIMSLAIYGFLAEQVVVLLACTFLMGLQSTLFGPVKYAYLPQALSERELTGGNGMIEMGTFIAILLGNVAGGLLISSPDLGRELVGFSCFFIAIGGRIAAQFVPCFPASAPDLKVNWNPFSETLRNLFVAKADIVVFRSMLGISWMWFFGAVFLSQFPVYAKEVLQADEQVAALLLTVFSLGIGLGSLLCEMLSRRHVEIGLVPLGAIGMSVFAIDLGFASMSLPDETLLYNIGSFLSVAQHWRVLIDLFLLALSAGLYSVPMYALIQSRSQEAHCARTIAANNVLNALFIVSSSIFVGLLIKFGVELTNVFILLGIANVFVAAYIFLLVPEYSLRFISWIFSHLIYRFKIKGDDHIPEKGAALLICNHVSFIDAVLLMGASPRPICFVMDYQIFRIPVLGWLFRLAKAIPIAPARVDEKIYQQAFEQSIKVLQKGGVLAIFPEGKLTRNGELGEFKGGVMKVLSEVGTPIPIIPMALVNLWGSFFSRIEDGKAMLRPFRRGIWNRVSLNIGPAIPDDQATLDVLRKRVKKLLD